MPTRATPSSTTVIAGTASKLRIAVVQRVSASRFAGEGSPKFEQTYIYVSPAKQTDEPTLRECVLAGHQLAARVLRSPGATMEA